MTETIHDREIASLERWLADHWDEQSTELWQRKREDLDDARIVRDTVAAHPAA